MKCEPIDPRFVTREVETLDFLGLRWFSNEAGQLVLSDEYRITEAFADEAISWLRACATEADQRRDLRLARLELWVIDGPGRVHDIPPQLRHELAPNTAVLVWRTDL